MFERLTINGKQMETIADVKAEVRLFTLEPTSIVHDASEDRPWNADAYHGRM